MSRIQYAVHSIQKKIKSIATKIRVFNVMHVWTRLIEKQLPELDFIEVYVGTTYHEGGYHSIEYDIEPVDRELADTYDDICMFEMKIEYVLDELKLSLAREKQILACQMERLSTTSAALQSLRRSIVDPPPLS